MNVLEKLALKLALRRLASKVARARKEGSAMLRFLDGWKSFIVVVGFIAATVYGLVTGHDVGGLVQGLLGAIGWTDGDLVERAKALATVVAPLLIAIWAASSRLWKAVRQWRAGAKPGELLSAQGYVRQALEDGTLQIDAFGPRLRG